MKRQSILVLASLTLAIMLSSSKAATFQGLGDLPGGEFDSRAWDVSSDGSVVVGWAQSAQSSGPDGESYSPYEAFRWTASGGMIGLGDLPGGGFNSQANGVSANGSVVVGYDYSTGHGTEAFRWEDLNGNGQSDPGEMQGLGDIPGGYFESFGADVCSNGSVIVGMSSSAAGYEAFRWTASDGMVGLGDLPGGEFRSQARAVSANGSIVVGFSDSALSSNEAFRWEDLNGNGQSDPGEMQGLGDIPGGDVWSQAYGVSADGSVLVGRGSSAAGPEAFRWTASDGMVGLGDLPGGEFRSQAWDVSANGQIVVGYSETDFGFLDNEAFIWDSTNGMRNLKDVLVNDYALDLTGWTLKMACGISDDGLTIVGYGINPSGYTEAWVATVPEPITLLLLGLGGLLLRKRRAT